MGVVFGGTLPYLCDFLDIVGDCDQASLYFDLLDSPQQEPPEALVLFDVAED